MLYEIRVRRDFFTIASPNEAFTTQRFDFVLDCATNTQACLLAGKILGMNTERFTTSIEEVRLMSQEDIDENSEELRDFDEGASPRAVSHAARRAEALSTLPVRNPSSAFYRKAAEEQSV